VLLVGALGAVLGLGACASAPLPAVVLPPLRVAPLGPATRARLRRLAVIDRRPRGARAIDLGPSLDEALRQARLSEPATPDDLPVFSLQITLSGDSLREEPGLDEGPLAWARVDVRVELTDSRGLRLLDQQLTGHARHPSGPQDQEALGEAASAVLVQIVARVADALDRLGVGPSSAGSASSASGATAPPASPVSAAPPVFLIERINPCRTQIETLFVESSTARILRHEIGRLADPGAARPGLWLLSRRTAEGRTLSDAAYESLARALAPRFSLTREDDARRYRLLGLAAAATGP
jgi:hypothetical protein